MTVKEAIEVLNKPSDHIKTIHIKDKGKVVCREEIVYSADLVQAFEMAIEALEKQSKLERVIEKLENEVKDLREDCNYIDAYKYEEAIKIIKEELT